MPPSWGDRSHAKARGGMAPLVGVRGSHARLRIPTPSAITLSPIVEQGILPAQEKKEGGIRILSAFLPIRLSPPRSSELLAKETVACLRRGAVNVEWETLFAYIRRTVD